METLTETIPATRPAEGIWGNVLSYHPFEPELERAEGIYLYDTDGKRYIDASGGPLAQNMAHGDRRIIDAMKAQLDKFEYCHPILSNRPRAELCAKIAEVAPGDLNTTYLVSGGSEAVETAIELARQYHLARGRTEKSKIISTWDSYHGMSLGALSVSGGPSSRKAFAPMLIDWPHIHLYRAGGPPAGMSEDEFALQCAHELGEQIHFVGPEQVAAFIATPIGAGKDYGLFPPVAYWQAVRDICDRYDVLLIADEVVTGWGRTGKWFAMEHFGVQADIMTTAKGISSLYAPLGAVTASDEVAAPFKEGEYLVHGFTCQGHPVAAAAGKAVIDIIQEDGLVENSASVGEYLHFQRDRILAHKSIADVRGRGLLMVPELVADKDTMEFFPIESDAESKLQAIALKNGLAFYLTLYGPRRPTAQRRGHPMFIMPPLCITREQVDELMDRFDATLTEWEEAMGL